MKKQVLLKRLHELLLLIVKANDEELDQIALELLEIEKKLLTYSKK